MELGHIVWMRENVLDLLKVGGIWGVPRSGLAIRKEGENKLVVAIALPWLDDCDMEPQELLDCQDRDVAAIAAHCSAAGIDFEDGRPKRTYT